MGNKSPPAKCVRCGKVNDTDYFWSSVYGFCPDCHNSFIPLLGAIRKFHIKDKPEYPLPDKCPRCEHWTIELRPAKKGYTASSGCNSEKDVCASCAFAPVRDKL